MVFHETLEAQQKAKQLDSEYNSKIVTPEDLNKTKEDAKKIFGTFKPKEKVYDPTKPIEDTKMPDMSDTGIENIPENKNSEREKLLKEKLSKKGENSKNFIVDTGEFQKIKGLENIDFNIDGENFEAEVLNKIGGNYIKTKLENGEYNYENDLKQSISNTKDEIINDVKNIPDSTTYDVALENINHSKDIKTQLEGIETLYALAYSNEGTLGKTTLDKFKNKRKKSLKEQFDKIKSELEILEQNEQKNEEEQKKQQELIKEYNNIVEQANEIEAGDIFPANDDEKVNSHIEQISSK